MRICNSPQKSHDIAKKNFVKHSKPFSHYHSTKQLCCAFPQITCAFNSALVKSITVIPVLSGHLKIDKTQVLMTNGSLMRVKSIAECSHWSILQYF